MQFRWNRNFLLVVLVMISLTFSYIPQVMAETQLNLEAESAILVDGETGKILYAKNIDEPLPIASMTKIMTEYLVLEAVKEGRMSWDQKTSISDYVFKISQNRGLSNVPLRKDYQYSIKELFEAAAIYSANGAAIALAEVLGGSESSFVQMMNEKAKELGMTNYKFVNSTGLNNNDLMGMHPSGTSASDENMLSAKDTAILAYSLLRDYPEVLKTSKVPKKVFRQGTSDAINMDNWNWMLPTLVFGYEGMDGLKTGSTDIAGYSFTGTAKRNNMRLISVIMKANSYESRFAETKKLMDYGFSNFAKKELIPAGYSIPEKSKIPVEKGKAKTVSIGTSKPLVSTVRRGEEKKYVPTYIFDKKMMATEGTLKAPLNKGQKVGLLVAKIKGSDYEYITADGIKRDSVPVVAQEEVKEAGWFTLLFRGIGNFFRNLLGNLV